MSANSLNQRQRLFDIRARLSEIAELLLNARSFLQHPGNIIQITEMARYRERLCKLIERFFRLAQHPVNVTQVVERDRFATKVFDGALNIERMLVIFERLLRLAHV